MEELIFVVTKTPDGGYTARALGFPIVAEAADRETLQERVQEAVLQHFGEEQGPKVIRLHMSAR